MYKRGHHRQIASVLRALDAEMLWEHRCYFGGGTAIALQRGEYRESVDIDFMISDIGHYRALRKTLNTHEGLRQLFGIGCGPLEEQPDIRADQYGIRTRLNLDGNGIKFEIVFEARIEFDEPGCDDVLLGVTTLTPVDLAASKLLANVDRWAYSGVFSRDIIDLAMLELSGPDWRRAVAKAAAAYGDAVKRDATAAVNKLKDDPEKLGRCLDRLAVDVPQALVLKKLKELPRRFQ